MKFIRLNGSILLCGVARLGIFRVIFNLGCIFYRIICSGITAPASDA